MPEKDQEFVEFVLQYLIDDPTTAEIKRTIDEKGVLIEVKVPEDQMGKLIGKGGITVQSIRNLLGAIGTKMGQRIYLKILEPVDKKE